VLISSYNDELPYFQTTAVLKAGFKKSF